MTDVRSPARPWFDLVTEQIAVRGWGIAELARRAKVGRPTIYGWRDSPGKPQSGPVNAVADVLGIDRRRANELAGIIPRPESDRVSELLANDDDLRETLLSALDGDWDKVREVTRIILESEARDAQARPA